MFRLCFAVQLLAIALLTWGCSSMQYAAMESVGIPKRDILVDRVEELTAVPSASVFVMLRAQSQKKTSRVLALGNPVYAGVDYGPILALAEQEAQLILWDGGNNDFPFVRPDLHIVLVDPLRPGHESSHHPGEAVLRMADIVVIAKSNSAADADIQRVSENVRRINPDAALVRAASPVQLEAPEQVRGKRVLVVEDGPSITHGGMSYGAGYVAATHARAGDIVNPRPYAVGGIAAMYQRYSHIGPVLPALGYHPEQLEELRATIAAVDADVVVTATPCELAALIRIEKPVVRARYEYAEAGEPGLGMLLEEFLRRKGLLPIE